MKDENKEKYEDIMQGLNRLEDIITEQTNVEIYEEVMQGFNRLEDIITEQTKVLLDAIKKVDETKKDEKGRTYYER